MLITHLVNQLNTGGIEIPSKQELESLWKQADEQMFITYHLFHVNFEDEYINLTRKEVVEIYVNLLKSMIFNLDQIPLEKRIEEIEYWIIENEGYYYKLYKTVKGKLIKSSIMEFGLNDIIAAL